MGLSPEMSKRHSWRWSIGLRSAPCRGVLYINAVVRSCSDRCSAGVRAKSRSRTWASVAAMRVARSTCIGCRYLSMRRASSSVVSAAAVAKLSLAMAPGASRSLTRRLATGSRPLTGLLFASNRCANSAG